MGSLWQASAHIRVQLHCCPHILASSQGELLSDLLVIQQFPNCVASLGLWPGWPSCLEHASLGFFSYELTFSFSCVSPWVLHSSGGPSLPGAPSLHVHGPLPSLSLDLSHSNEMDFHLPWHLFGPDSPTLQVSSEKSGTIPPMSLYSQMLGTIWVHNLGNYVLTDKENKSRSIAILEATGLFCNVIRWTTWARILSHHSYGCCVPQIVRIVQFH